MHARGLYVPLQSWPGIAVRRTAPQRRTPNPDTGTVRVSGFRVRAFSAPRNDHVFNCQTAWRASSPAFFLAPGTPSSFSSHAKREGDGAPGRPYSSVAVG